MIVFYLQSSAINFISIMDNCYEYLLSVAEKIIKDCADKKTIEKYFALKSKLTEKCTQQDCSRRLSSSNKENLGGSRSVICQSRKSKSKEKGLSRARVQSYSSKTVSEKTNFSTFPEKRVECLALQHVVAVLKNAEACPTMLKTITFSPNSYENKIASQIESLQTSLRTIYGEIAKPQVTETSQQMLIDNKWLIQKLSILIDENGVLRRMVGHRVY